MTDKVKDWMSSPVVVVDADSSVSYALTLMRRRNIHSLVVVMGDEKPVYGILTTTDIRDKIIIAERNPAETRVQRGDDLPRGDCRSGVVSARVLAQNARHGHPPYARRRRAWRARGHDLRNRYLPRRRGDRLGQGKISSGV